MKNLELLFRYDESKFKFVGLLAPASAFMYPYWLFLFYKCIEKGNNLMLSGILAGVVLTLAFATPLVSLYTALVLERSAKDSKKYLFAKRVAYFAVASPPIYTFTGVILYMLGHGSLDIWLVSGLWLILGSLIYLSKETEIHKFDSCPAKNKLRSFHKVAALVLFAAFVAPHLFNHLITLTGFENQKEVMRVLRLFYRFPLLEVTLVAGFLSLIGSGLSLVMRATRKNSDTFRTLQIASGIYLMIFLLSHMNAVFVFARWFLNIESDWRFASGAPSGLIHDSWNIRLLPLYFFSVVAVILHSFLGLRLILIRRGFSVISANRVAFFGAGTSLVLASLISIALVGL